MPRPPVTVERLRDLVAAGQVRVGAGVELVAGVLLMAHLPEPAVVAAVTDLAAALERALPDHRVAVREAVALGDRDLLRPEVALLRPVWGADGVARACWPSAGFTPAAALALAVFVGEAEAPLRWRAHRCARAGVAEAWTLAVGEGTASRWRQPWEGRYLRRDPLPPGEAVAADAAPDRAVIAWRHPGAAAVGRAGT